MAIEPVTREERFLAAAGGQNVTPLTPITRKEQLLQGIIDAVKSGGATPDVIEGAVNDYLNANPVQPGATDEQAAQIEQNKTDIADLQTEVDELKESSSGSVDLTGVVRSVNGKTPDEKGNVEIDVSGSGENQTYTLPVANANTLGGVKVQPKTAAMTQPVGADADGNLYTLPPAQSTTEVGGVEFANHVGNLYSPANRLTRWPAVGDNVLDLTGGTQKYVIFRAKPNTTYVITVTSIVSVGNMGRADSLGICTQAPAASGKPVDQIGFVSSGGYGQYFVVKTNSLFTADDAYLVWQPPGDSNLTDVAIYEGSSIEGYDTINAYSDLNGTATSDSLAIRKRNMAPELVASLNKVESAVQPEQLVADVANLSSYYSISPRNPESVGHSTLADIRTFVNSAVAAQSVLKTETSLGVHYAHCPSACIANGNAYIVAFQNARNTDDVYIYPECSTELYIVDVNTMEVLAQHTVAGNGMSVGELSFAYGSGAAQGVLVDDATLRVVFVAKLQNAEGVDEWYQCYRDFDIATETFGDIGLCQIVKDGNAYPFTTANTSLYIQPLTDTSVNTNIVCQPAKVGEIWYVACGCQAQWENMPILKTSDWINFEYWATPSVGGNKAKFEMAITTDGNYLYTATRQATVGLIQMMRVKLSDGLVSGSCMIPDGNMSRPHLILRGENLYVFHIATSERKNSSQISVMQNNALHLGAYEAVTLPPMVYPSVVTCDGGYFAAYMVPYGLYCCKIPAIEKYSFPKATAIMAKLIELVADE